MVMYTILLSCLGLCSRLLLGIVRYPSLAASFEPLAYCWNLASLSLFCRYYFGRYSSEQVHLAPLSYPRGRCTCYSDRLHDLSVTILRCYKDAYVNSFFPHAAIFWNSLPEPILYYLPKMQ